MSKEKLCHKCNANPVQYRNRCKPCINEYLRGYMARNPEKNAKRAEQTRQWVKDNPERHAENTRLWKKNNPEKNQEHFKKWYYKSDDNKKLHAERCRKIRLAGSLYKDLLKEMRTT